MPDVRTQTTGERKFALSECGYIADGKPVPAEYLTRVTSIRNRTTVISPLQDTLQLRVDSHWEPIVPTSLLSTGNVLLQVATKGRKSLVTRATSRRIWSGSSPMRLSLQMRFEAYMNPFREVVEPCRILQSMALPSESVRAKTQGEPSAVETALNVAGKLFGVNTSSLPFLSPPGPTPFSTEGVLNFQRTSNISKDVTAIQEGLQGGDLIFIELGRFLTFYNVVIRTVSASIPIKFDPHGDPVSATLTVEFETYEMMTTQGLSQAYEKTISSENDSGSFVFKDKRVGV